VLTRRIRAGMENPWTGAILRGEVKEEDRIRIV
jgi:hypothetical protein